MGTIKCKVHGYSGMYSCCDHVSDAMQWKQPLATRKVEVGGDAGSCLTCNDCVVPANAATQGLGDDFSLVCSSCLADWYRSTGQGELLPAAAPTPT